MSNPNPSHHATITLERTYSASIERVFTEFADPVARACWSAPSNDALIYDQADFRPGGHDRFRCGPKGDPKFHGETIYHRIAPNQLVVSSETVETEGHPLAVSLNTLEFTSIGDQTRLKVTVQIVSFVGPDLVHSYESGNKSALEGLAKHLEANP